MCNIVRQLRETDLPQLRKIHEEYYKNEFDMDELFENSIGLFAVTDEQDNIICVTSIRPIAEAVLMTDKNRTVRERRSALFMVLDVAEFITKKAGFEQLHVFIQDEQWIRHLTKAEVGFKPTAGKALVRLL
jgi:hypothetical protein